MPSASSTASADVLGILLAGLVNVLNLDMFVIGGGVASAWDAFAPQMFAELRERSLVYAATAPEDPLDQARKKARPRQIAKLHAQENHHHPRPARQRRRPLRRSQNSRVVAVILRRVFCAEGSMQLAVDLDGFVEREVLSRCLLEILFL